MMKLKKVTLIAVVLIIIITLAYKIINNDIPKTIIVKYEPGVVSVDFQRVKVKNKFGVTMANTHFDVVSKGTDIVDRTLSYKISDDNIQIETFNYGGYVEYNLKSNQFDTSHISEKTIIEEPTGELIYSNDGYIGGEHQQFTI